VLEPASALDSLRTVHDEPPVPMTPVALDQRDRAILDFEREAWKLTVPKERAIRERFGFSAARYHQLLHRVIERPEAIAYDPMVVRRLRRVRDARRRRRAARDLGVRV
jgi:hypothetical protein